MCSCRSKKVFNLLCCCLLQLQQLVQSLQMQQQKPQPSLLQALDAGLVVQLQALTAQLTAAATANSLNPLEQRVSSFNKVMLQSAAVSLFLCFCGSQSWRRYVFELAPCIYAHLKAAPVLLEFCSFVFAKTFAFIETKNTFFCKSLNSLASEKEMKQNSIKELKHKVSGILYVNSQRSCVHGCC